MSFEDALSKRNAERETEEQERNRRVEAAKEAQRKALAIFERVKTDEILPALERAKAYMQEKGHFADIGCRNTGIQMIPTPEFFVEFTLREKGMPTPQRGIPDHTFYLRLHSFSNNPALRFAEVSPILGAIKRPEKTDSKTIPMEKLGQTGTFEDEVFDPLLAKL